MVSSLTIQAKNPTSVSLSVLPTASVWVVGQVGDSRPVVGAYKMAEEGDQTLSLRLESRGSVSR